MPNLDLALLILGAWVVISIPFAVIAGKVIKGKPSTPHFSPTGLASATEELREERQDSPLEAHRLAALKRVERAQEAAQRARARRAV